MKADYRSNLFLTFSSHLLAEVCAQQHCVFVSEAIRQGGNHLQLQGLRLSCCLVYMMDAYVMSPVSAAALFFHLWLFTEERECQSLVTWCNTDSITSVRFYGGFNS